jgi:hypothetical protein
LISNILEFQGRIVAQVNPAQAQAQEGDGAADGEIHGRLAELVSSIQGDHTKGKEKRKPKQRQSAHRNQFGPQGA